MCPALQFEASAELERASRAYDRVGPDELARLREMREAEAAKNARTLAQLARAGASAGARAARRPVKYGDDVQLQHVSSGLFVCARRSIAELVRENLRTDRLLRVAAELGHPHRRLWRRLGAAHPSAEEYDPRAL